MRSFLIPLLAAATLALGGCIDDVEDLAEGTPPVGPETVHPAVDIELASYAAVDQLLEFSRAPLSPDKPIVVTTLVDSSDLTMAVPLGRLISEQMGTRLANAGFTVRELRFGNALRIREESGELVLSRNLREISRSVGAQAVIAGTYTPAATRVFVNARLIQASTGDLLSAVDFDLPRGADMNSLVPPVTDKTEEMEGDWEYSHHRSCWADPGC
jgi:TolB-like protein